MPLRLISNLAETSFELDGRGYASVEGFWQGLKFPSAADRRRIAGLHGGAAKRAGEEAIPAEHFKYEGQKIVPGTHAHWKLMERACWAKFTQDEAAREALLATLPRPLTHVMRKDSTTIPGAIMAEIWTKIRKRLAEEHG